MTVWRSMRTEARCHNYMLQAEQSQNEAHGTNSSRLMLDFWGAPSPNGFHPLLALVADTPKGNVPHRFTPSLSGCMLGRA